MQLLNEHFQLRVAEPSDIPEIIQLFAQAFHFKLNAFNIDSTNPNQRQQLEAIWNTLARKKNSQQFVVTENEKIIATFCLVTKETQFMSNSFTKTPFSNYWRYGIAHYIKQKIFFSLFDYTPKENEVYLAHIAVLSTYQGHGIAYAILQWIAQYSKNILKKIYLSLYVDIHHKGALYLYQKDGFYIERKESSCLTQSIFHIQHWYYMLKKIN
ncbi:ribosomal-protein-alanine acetyltransferase [Proteus vulgaris]|uniref:GNAT family N-acetyltransferase n=1 Tax=Proteus vulgaris TaxID=585 RepID=UPI000DFA2DF4|nr:GNAT family N-acetyltransferase [Proteus vulgaris]SUC01079.1 ribosomal-protein-alanine acetyltransferase [Proteus vulgaris]